MTILAFRVSDADTATALGSGDVPVLATPRLLAWMEAATVAAVAGLLADGQTSVGVSVSMQHRRATGIGGRVLITVNSTTVQDGRAECDVVAFEQLVRERAGAANRPAESPTSGHEPAAGSRIIATALITRAIVDRAAFEARLKRD